MECVSDMEVKAIWGNYNFDYLYSEALGYSGGILCVWDPNIFQKSHHTISDNFVATYGTWIPTKSKILLISIYAPQSEAAKRMLWSFISEIINRWDGECVVMGDFNEVRVEDERMGSVFNVRGARDFNNFITSAGLVDVQLEGYAFTWSHPSAAKMSKLDRFLVSEGFLTLFPHTSAIYFDSIILGSSINALDRWLIDTWKSSQILRISQRYDQIQKKLQLLKKDSVLRSCSRCSTASLPIAQDFRTGLLLFNEVCSWCKFKQKQAMVFKVDFAKAYDSVRWDFLDDVLEAFGFGFKWRSWVLGSLSSGMASIVINGSPTAEFKFHCGLKQGDPICLLLVFIIMESLHVIPSRVMKRVIQGIKMDHNTQISSFIFRGGIEAQQLAHLQNLVGTSILSNSDDRWVCNLNGDGSFQVYSDRLPTTADLISYGTFSLDQSYPGLVDVESDVSSLSSYEEWLSWFKDIRLGSILKCMLEENLLSISKLTMQPSYETAK
ncbi:RNA-directed DNA polymerase, eukaryota [Tanacetum coccineum]